MALSAQLSVRVDKRGEMLYLALEGELDFSESMVLERYLREAEGQRWNEIRLDLARLTFIDCAGVRTLVQATGRASDGGWKLEVVNSQGVVRKVFELLGVHDLLESGQSNGARGSRAKATRRFRLYKGVTGSYRLVPASLSHAESSEIL